MVRADRSVESEGVRLKDRVTGRVSVIRPTRARSAAPLIGGTINPHARPSPKARHNAAGADGHRPRRAGSAAGAPTDFRRARAPVRASWRDCGGPHHWVHRRPARICINDFLLICLNNLRAPAPQLIRSTRNAQPLQHDPRRCVLSRASSVNRRTIASLVR